MGKVRTGDELAIHDGPYRSFEWFWSHDDTMPALDIYQLLAPREQDDFLASVIHWGNIAPGQRALQSRINEESVSPLIVAIKAGKHRFTAFREERGAAWIVVGHYLKEGEKRDKTGHRAISRTLEARKFYLKRVKSGTYYERS